MTLINLKCLNESEISNMEYSKQVKFLFSEDKLLIFFGGYNSGTQTSSKFILLINRLLK